MITRLNSALAAAGRWLQPVLLLFIRFYWGWQYHVTGMGKLKDLSRPTQFFASLHLPFPHVNAVIVAVTECVGGLLVMLGLGTRLLAPIFLFEMLVAYWTADREALRSIFSDSDKFTGAAPFQFAAVFLILIAFGAGALSLDALIFRKAKGSGNKA